MAAKKSLVVVVSLDVEEEGLFCGKYKCWDAGVENVSALYRLNPLIDRGIRPTLFCAYSVLSNYKAKKCLEDYLAHAEFGAHLHHWNTPPLTSNIPDSGYLSEVPANQVTISLMSKKLRTLLTSLRDFTGLPARSFRMGRWDMHSAFFPLLVEQGIHTDASIRPLHCAKKYSAGPNHFAAPADPYWLRLSNGELLEAPLTVIPLLPKFTKLFGNGVKYARLAASLRHWGALALLPVYHPFWLLKFTTAMHVQRGGRVLSLTWHSSEMMPGATPHMKSVGSVNRFFAKLNKFFNWLEENYNISYMTMDQLHTIPDFTHAEKIKYRCDWQWHKENVNAH